MADRIVVMSEGIVQQIGTPREIYEKPINLFVATFIGAPAMNVVNAKFVKDGLLLSTNEKLSFDKNQSEQVKSFYKKEIERLNGIDSRLDNALKDETDKRHDVYLLAKDKIKEIINSHKEKESGEFDVLFGVRPEDITICDKKETNTLLLTIDAVELMGSEYYVHSKIGEQKIIFKAPANLELHVGDSINVKVDINKVHAFDMFTKRAML